MSKCSAWVGLFADYLDDNGSSTQSIPCTVVNEESEVTEKGNIDEYNAAGRHLQ